MPLVANSMADRLVLKCVNGCVGEKMPTDAARTAPAIDATTMRRMGAHVALETVTTTGRRHWVPMRTFVCNVCGYAEIYAPEVTS
jgi:hypothetical protein